jgi:hypothetical protein
MFMKRQTYAGDVTWIIVDDCIPRTTDAIQQGFKDKWTIVKINPTPNWSHGMNTQSRNMRAATDFVLSYFKEGEVTALFIIEDDDYYKPQYLERMMARLNGYKVLGEMNTIYYNVFYRNYFINRNTSHVSLFQLAFKPEMIPLFTSCYDDRFVDFKFFEKLHAQGFVGRGEVSMFNEGNLAIGMKGMSGRPGIGAGHGRLMNMRPDPHLTFLSSQISPEDVQLYAGYNGGRGEPQHPLFAKRSL